MAANNELQVTSAEIKDGFMKFASSAFKSSKTAFNRARQITGERFGNAERTELDAQFEHLCANADRIKSWTEKIAGQTGALLRPNPGARVEDYVFEKLDKKSPARPTNSFLLGQTLTYAGRELNPGSEYGSALGKTGTALKKIGNAEKDYMQKTMSQFLHPLRTFLDNDMKTVYKERRALEVARIDLDAARNRVKRAPSPEKLREAEGGFRVAQADFDRQYEITKLLLEGVTSAQNAHLQSLHAFIDAIGMYHSQCQLYISELQKDLQSISRTPSHPPARPEAAKILTAPSAPTATTTDDKSASRKKAKVLYDYDAGDESELSLLADEIVAVHEVEGMDSDWVMAERGSQKGKVPLTYIELL